MATILKVENIQKAFYAPAKTSILKGVFLEAHQGESIAIMGRSGEGKSTLLHILGTLENPCSGTITIANQEVSRFNKTGLRNRHIGFVFQSFHLLEDYTVIDNVLMPSWIGRQNIQKGSPKYQDAMALLESMEISDRAHYNTKLLSGGEKQRVAIARALNNNPDIIFADEPTGNLDRQTSIGIQDLLINFTKKNHKTLIVVTHDKDLALRCDRQFELRDGLLAETTLQK